MCILSYVPNVGKIVVQTLWYGAVMPHYVLTFGWVSSRTASCASTSSCHRSPAHPYPSELGHGGTTLFPTTGKVQR